jgi:hypothetical protein
MIYVLTLKRYAGALAQCALRLLKIKKIDLRR